MIIFWFNDYTLLILFRWSLRTPLNTWRSLNRLDRKWNLLVVEDPKNAANFMPQTTERMEEWNPSVVVDAASAANYPNLFSEWQQISFLKHHSLHHHFVWNCLILSLKVKKTLFLNSFVLFSETNGLILTLLVSCIIVMKSKISTPKRNLKYGFFLYKLKCFIFCWLCLNER